MSQRTLIGCALAALVGSLVVVVGCVGDDPASPVDRADGAVTQTDAAPLLDASSAMDREAPAVVDGGDTSVPDYDGGKGTVTCTASLDCAAAVTYCCVSALVPQGCQARDSQASCIQKFYCNRKANCLAGACVGDGTGTSCKAAPDAGQHVACLLDGDCTGAEKCRPSCYGNNTAQGLCLTPAEQCF